MIVYIVVYNYTKCGECTVFNEGVFSTRELAENYIEEQCKKSITHIGRTFPDDYEIEEWELDKEY